MINNRNEFRVSGRVISERPGENEGTVILTLIIKNEFRDTFPEIRCQKELVPEHKPHTVLEIRGYAANEVRKQNDKVKVIPRLYALEVKPAATLLEEEFGIKGRFWYPSRSMYCIVGRVESVEEEMTPSGPYVRYSVKTDIPGTDQSTTLRIDWKKIDRHPEIVCGDTVCAVCKINTPKKVVGTETRHFLDLDVFDLEKIED